MKTLSIGVLAFHGDVVEHSSATRRAAANLNYPMTLVEVRTKQQTAGLHGLIIPGGESTTLHKLAVREHMWEDMKKIPAVFGTCAGAILSASTVTHKTPDQESLGRIDITIDRNAYGRQSDSFEQSIQTTLGTVQAVFIRAPRIQSAGKSVGVLARHDGEIIACEQRTKHLYTLVACFHPELTCTVFHQYFLKEVRRLV